VWLYALDGKSRERLALENRDWDEFWSVWTPDGKAVVYASNQAGNWKIYRRVPGALKSEVLLDREVDVFPKAISQDGTIAYDESHPTTGNDIWLLNADGKARPWLAGPRNEEAGKFSPDGRWLSYRSDESGRHEIYVKPVAGDGARIQISSAGGGYSVWSPEGSKLFYQEAGAIWEVELGRGEVPVPGPRRKLFDGGWALNPPGEWDYCVFDIMPDGERFVMIRAEPKAIPDRIHVVVNWYDELRRLVPVK
jgi:Tol biopolymer transport system component